jgi:hypothetical protein
MTHITDQQFTKERDYLYNDPANEVIEEPNPENIYKVSIEYDTIFFKGFPRTEIEMIIFKAVGVYFPDLINVELKPEKNNKISVIVRCYKEWEYDEPFENELYADCVMIIEDIFKPLN